MSIFLLEILFTIFIKIMTSLLNVVIIIYLLEFLFRIFFLMLSFIGIYNVIKGKAREVPFINKLRK